MDICLYCKKGKVINISEFGDVSIKTYIHGDLLVTEAFNYRNDKDDFSAMKINMCPVCKEKLAELKEEEIEEELE
jgi:uncharacterized protein with PIN domain